MRRYLLRGSAGGILLVGIGAVFAGEATDADVALLKAHGMATDGPGLVKFFQQRTTTLADEARLKELVRQLGDEQFKVREQASRQLVMFGSRARRYLQVASKDPDPEIARRAQDCLERIVQGARGNTISAAVRVLAHKKSPHAAAVFLNYLPMAEEEGVAETIRRVLPLLAQRDDKPEPALVAALTDKSAVKRAAAAAALARAGSPDVKPRIRKLLHDRDPQVRLQVSLALLAARDKEAVDVLIGLLDELPFREADPLMNVLERLAGTTMPPVVYGPDAAAHRKYRDAWQAWWKEQQGKIEPAQLEQALNPRGFTTIVLLDKNRIEDLDANNRVRWKIDNVVKPLDVQILPGEERVLVAEVDAHRVTERDLKGDIVWKKNVPGPLTAQRLPNGNTFITTQGQLLEVDKMGHEVFSYSRPDGSLFMRATKLRNGDIACLVQLGVPRFLLLSPSERGVKEVKSWGVQVRTSGGRLDVLPNGHVLIPEMDNNRVVEYDAEGQIVWEVTINQPIAALRLPNGNTMVTLMTENRAVELDRNGKNVWQFKADTRVTRALRR
jgi:hypothetical protein